jgi:PAS domain S-box-containing protein
MKPDFPNGPSISTRLSLSLVSIVLVVVATILAIGFAVYSRNLKSDLDGQSKEYASRLADILALPLWNYDETQIRRIGAVFSQNQMIHGLLVEDDRGRALFEARKAEDQAPKILRSDEIRIEGRSIGKVSIEITLAMHLLHLRLLLIGTLLTLLAALVVMALGTNHLLRRFLRSPLESLEQAMDRVASGDFSHALDHPHRELRGIARRYTEMVERVHWREEKLQQMNRELMSEIAERRTVEENLALSNALLKTQLENSPDGILMVSPEARIILANPAFVDMWQLPEYPVAMGSVEVLFDAMGERLKSTGGAPSFPALAEEPPSGKPRRELHLDDGRVFQFHCVSMLGQGGRDFGRAFTFHDATEQKRTEEMLRENEVRYRTLFKNSPISLWEEDCSEVKRLLDGLRPSVPDFREYLESHPEVVVECMKLVRVVDVNDETLRMLKAETRESLMHGLQTVRTDEMPAAFRHGLLSLLEGETRCIVETTHRALTGEPLDVSVSLQVAPGYEETWAKVFVSVQNITERKQAHEILRRANLVLENSPVILFRWRAAPGWPVELVSDNIRQLGYEPEDLLSGEVPFADLIHPEDLERVAAEVRDFTEGGVGRFQQMYRVVTRDGRVRWVDDRTFVEHDGEGRVTHYQGIVMDITERRRNEEELRQKNEEMERFVYTISHDLKSPLVTIQAFLKYLEQDLQSRDHERARRDMDYIGNAAARMNRLLDELLELSRIGRKVNPPENVFLQDVVREALGLVAGRIIERGIHVEVAPEPILLHGDRTRLVEVFQNLIDNAAKFTGDQESPTIWIGAEEDEGGMVLHVRDNGVGVEPRYHEKLFGLFEKLDAGSEGTGVGLALVKRIIEIHSGRIWVESEGQGRGTVFRFTLPGARKSTAG